MAKTAPKKKAVSIIEELNKIDSADQVDNFTLAHYKNEAEKLKKAGHLSDAFIILGMIACLEGDEDKMHSSHKNAIIYAPYNPHTTRNYAVSLLKVGAIKEAYEYFLRTYNIDPTEKNFLNDVIETLYDLSVYTNKYEADLEYYASRWKELTGEDHPVHDDPEATATLIEACDKMINEDPNAASDMDSGVWDLAQKLTEGVELGK